MQVSSHNPERPWPWMCDLEPASCRRIGLDSLYSQHADTAQDAADDVADQVHAMRPVKGLSVDAKTGRAIIIV